MDNLKGAGLMTLAMLAFAVEDMFVKKLSASVPPWQIILSLGLGGATVFGVILTAQGRPHFTRAYLSVPVLLRNLGELIGTLGFITAIALIPLSAASAIIQANPLVVTLGAALFLGEPVGWRRWTAIGVGFAGVLLVIRPGMEAFDPASLFAVQAVLGLALRDLATRRVAGAVSSMQLSFLAFLTLIPAALILAAASPQPGLWPDARLWGLTAGAVALGATGYWAIVAAMRVGEVSFVTPFRYSRLLFALVIGIAVFGERPDALMLTGAAIIVGSGLFTLWRERKQRVPA